MYSILNRGQKMYMLLIRIPPLPLAQVQRCTYTKHRMGEPGSYEPRTFCRGPVWAPRFPLGGSHNMMLLCVGSSRRAFMRRASPSHSSSAGMESSERCELGAIDVRLGRPTQLTTRTSPGLNEYSDLTASRLASSHAFSSDALGGGSGWPLSSACT